jgi:hypothetical protein
MTPTRPSSAGWLIGSAAVHDLVLLPVVGVVAWTLRRAIPAASWPAVRAGALVAGTLALVRWPYVRGYGASRGNPSLLPRDYTLGTLLAIAVILIVTAVAATAAVVRARRRSRA